MIRPHPMPVRSSTARLDRVASSHRSTELGGRLSTARHQESMETSLLSARQITLAPITAISVARQAREESQRNGRQGA
jgi:hypothetical protein